MPFSLFSSILEKNCKKSRLLNPWMYEAERVSSSHVNYPNICIWVSQQKVPTTSTTQFQFHLEHNCLFNLECKFYQYPPINPPSHINSNILSPSFVCLNDLFHTEGGRWSVLKMYYYHCCPRYCSLLLLTVEMSFELMSEDRSEGGMSLLLLYHQAFQSLAVQKKPPAQL